MVSINRDRFLQGLKYSGYIALALTIIFIIVKLIFSHTLSGFRLDSLTLGIGGLAWVIAGCIGPGRYKPVLAIALYNPRNKGSFNTYIKVSAFITDAEIESAKIIVDGTEIGELQFKNNVDEKVFKDTDLPKGSVHTIWLEATSKDKIHYSNKHLFTFYNPDDFTDAEIEVFETQEAKGDIPITDAYEKYIADKEQNFGSLSLGFFTAGTFAFILGLLYTAVFM